MKMPTAEMAIGRAIRVERQKLAMSQEELALQCELHRTYVGSIERGERNVSLRNILIIASALEISGAELLKRTGL